MGAVLDICQNGVVTFGGGLSMLPVLQREIVEKKGMGFRRMSFLIIMPSGNARLGSLRSIRRLSSAINVREFPAALSPPWDWFSFFDHYHLNCGVPAEYFRVGSGSKKRLCRHPCLRLCLVSHAVIMLWKNPWLIK